MVCKCFNRHTDVRLIVSLNKRNESSPAVYECLRSEIFVTSGKRVGNSKHNTFLSSSWQKLFCLIFFLILYYLSLLKSQWVSPIETCSGMRPTCIKFPAPPKNFFLYKGPLAGRTVLQFLDCLDVLCTLLSLSARSPPVPLPPRRLIMSAQMTLTNYIFLHIYMANAMVNVRPKIFCRLAFIRIGLLPLLTVLRAFIWIFSGKLASYVCIGALPF